MNTTRQADRRRTARVESINLVSCSAREDDATPDTVQLGRTLDISSHGVKVEIKTSMPTELLAGGYLMLTLALGDTILELRGRIVRARQDNDRQGVLGIEFSDPSPQTREKLAQFLQRSGARKAGSL